MNQMNEIVGGWRFGRPLPYGVSNAMVRFGIRVADAKEGIVKYGMNNTYEFAAELDALEKLGKLDGIVGLLDSGVMREGGWSKRFLVMEKIAGVPLWTWRCEAMEGFSPVSWGFGELALLASDALMALERVHRSGWIHGDPYPRNVMITPEGQAVWVDLELAGAVDGGYAEANIFVWALAAHFEDEFADAPLGALAEVLPVSVEEWPVGGVSFSDRYGRSFDIREPTAQCVAGAFENLAYCWGGERAKITRGVQRWMAVESVG